MRGRLICESYGRVSTKEANPKAKVACTLKVTVRAAALEHCGASASRASSMRKSSSAVIVDKRRQICW